ncbi:DUF5590 domain-containing protein [Niallia sp. Krafla_26]|uniref:cell wall elongation regulator TseB-like domain-containing protein n=1 Tax=Niallia sp. Krafla_26 TaxID=3064703 RepID=UPI003D166143
MKKWFFIIGFVVLMIVASSTMIYLKAVDPLKTVQEKAVKIAMDETSLSQVDDFHLYNGEESYFIIQGKDQKGTNLIVWVPEKKGKVFVKKASDGITRQEAINTVANEIGDDTIISVKLGMEKGIPLWEIHSRTNGDLLNYYSVEFETGEWLKKIENL